MFKDTYRDISFKIEHQLDPCNPFEDWEGEPPLAVLYDRDIKTYGTLPSFDECVTDKQLARHWRALCDIFDGLDSDYRYERNYGSCAAAAKRNVLALAISQLSNSDRLDTLEQAYQLIGFPARHAISRGYSQGDYAELLIVYTPEWCERVGIKWPRTSKARKALEAGMQGTIDLYSAWAWGDVYGAVIGNESCWGFYGSDHEESGLMDYVRGEIDYMYQKRTERLKELIKARVPVQLRADILNNVLKG